MAFSASKNLVLISFNVIVSIFNYDSNFSLSLKNTFHSVELKQKDRERVEVDDISRWSWKCIVIVWPLVAIATVVQCNRDEGRFRSMQSWWTLIGTLNLNFCRREFFRIKLNSILIYSATVLLRDINSNFCFPIELCCKNTSASSGMITFFFFAQISRISFK